MTHSPLRRIISKLWLPAVMMQPTSDGENAITVCQPLVMILRRPSQADETSTMRRHVFEYTELDYNRQRRHSAIGLISPEAFEARKVA